MTVSFDELPGEVRNQIYKYELALQDDEPIDPFVLDKTQLRSQLNIKLFQTSQNIHLEATSFFYSHIRFDFTESAATKIDYFLDRIGSRNAQQIRHIHVNFPIYTRLNRNPVFIKETSVHGIAKLRRRCINISTLTVPMKATEKMRRSLMPATSPAVLEALRHANVEFRTFLSPIEVMVEIRKGYCNAYLKSAMESHGWKVLETETEKKINPLLSCYDILGRGESFMLSSSDEDSEEESDSSRESTP